jgi:Tol biopolymer transport system component
MRHTISAALSLSLLTTAALADGPGLIAFSARKWEGEYQSRDVPGGVETTPVVGSIYTVRPDGTGLRRVVEPGRDANAPGFSPDGRWLYFQSNAGGSYRIERRRPDGSEPSTVVAPGDLGPWCKSVYGLSMATDGRIVFTAFDGRTGRVAVAEADGANPRVLAPDAGYLYMAALSPDGRTVVCSGPAAGYRLQRIELADPKPVLLTPDHPESFVPQFTPDGRTIVFFRRDGDYYRVDRDGRNLQRLTTGAKHVEFRLSPQDSHGSSDPPGISPDGRRIAYVADAEGAAEVHVMNLDGSNPRRLTHLRSPCGRVRWSPDGASIAFVSFVGKYPQLFLIPADGGEPRQLTRLDEAVYFLAWQPSP